MLDIDDAGRLKTGESANVGLGRLREAVGLNQPGQPFSLGMLQGRSLRFIVGHRADPNDAAKIYEDVKAFRAL